MSTTTFTMMMISATKTDDVYDDKYQKTIFTSKLI